MHGEGVISVHELGRDPVGLHPLMDLDGRLAILERRESGPEIVLADKDDGQPLEGGEVEALVPRPLFDGAVAEDGDGDLGPSQDAVGESAAHGMGHPASHDGRGAHDPGVNVDQVHGATPASATAGGAAEQLIDHGA